MAKRSARSAWAFAVVALVAQCGRAQETTSVDPVVTHFRDYRAALERKDYAAAETAAAAALEASEAVGGARTAVLAFNLANLRLELGRPADALAPAARAQELATTTPDSGVDPLLADITLGRAELPSNGPGRLVAAIGAAEPHDELESEAHLAATELGFWGIRAEQYEVAKQAWAAAGRLAGGAADPQFARGRARTGEGVAIFLGGIDRSQNPGTLATSEAHAADAAFADAMRLLAPNAFPASAGAVLTAGEVAYADAAAWRGALLAKLDSQNEPLPANASEQSWESEPAPAGDTRPLCELRFIADPQPTYPAEVGAILGVGAVVIHLILNPDGSIASRRLAAAAPPGGEDAVKEVMDQWSFERDAEPPADCRVPRSRFVVGRFVLE